MDFNNLTIFNTTRLPILPSLPEPIALFINTIGYIYIATSFNVVGFFLNIFCLIILINKTLKGDIYKYFILKTSTELGRVFLGTLFPLAFCTSCPSFPTFAVQLIRAYGFNYAASLFSTMSILSEIALTYDRLTIFKKNSKFFLKI
jgi:hypothetical protein